MFIFISFTHYSHLCFIACLHLSHSRLLSLATLSLSFAFILSVEVVVVFVPFFPHLPHFNFSLFKIIVIFPIVWLLFHLSFWMFHFFLQPPSSQFLPALLLPLQPTNHVRIKLFVALTFKLFLFFYFVLFLFAICSRFHVARRLTDKINDSHMF